MSTATYTREQTLPGSPTRDADASYYKDATELAALIRTKELSSREVVQAHLDRTNAVNPKLNAVESGNRVQKRHPIL